MVTALSRTTEAFGSAIRIVKTASLLFLLLNPPSIIARDVYKEELLLRPLGEDGGRVSASFKFTTTAPDGHPHYGLFPRAVGELMKAHSLREFRVSLTRGVWRDALWGFSPFPAPAGAAVSAWFNRDVKDVSATWYRLTNALSGQLCASLNFLDSTLTVQPEFSFQPSGVDAGNGPESSNTSYFRIGTLPGENVCTENLTPWKKLLPCSSKRGLATLFSARNIQDMIYHSVGLTARTVCSDSSCLSTVVELTQFVVLIFDLDAKGKTDWSLRSLFGIGINSICPLAESTRIMIEEKDFRVAQEPSEILPRGIKVYDVRNMVERGVQNIIVNYDKPRSIRALRKPLIHATRYVVGHGQEKGGIVTKISNGHSEPLPIVFLDVVPWYLRLYLHTLKITSDTGTTVNQSAIRFVPGRDRERPFVLELAVKLPPKSVVSISVDFERSLLKWLEYPPDANKGFYVGSALISTLLPNPANVSGIADDRTCSTFYDSLKDTRQGPVLIRIFTESLLVTLPTPDFSMPYNVICLACTVVALAFGPLHNITTKKLLILDPEDESNDSLPKRLLKKVKGFFKKKEVKKDEQTSAEKENPKDK